MTRHLQSISIETVHNSITLRQLAGERQSDSETDYYLQRKFGAAVYLLSAFNLYALNDDDPLADPIVDAGGGVLVYYDGLKDTVVERRSNASHHLGAVSLEPRTLAHFKTVEASDTFRKLLPKYDPSLGYIMERVGIELDEPVVMKRVEDIIKEQLLVDERPQLRIVE